ncbi:MAG: ATP-dependent protease, partial [Thermoguttaceae bacterium]|nr:ATP-dependent protease [Thermoguttaceae bacterium]
CKEILCRGVTWGEVELGYRRPEPGRSGRIRLLSFEPLNTFAPDLDDYRASRKGFTIDEWIDGLLGAIDYDAEGYDSHVPANHETACAYSASEAKLSMLARLLPFVERRLNLIELAPKGTGKSYVYGGISRYGWLASGGVVTRAKMFYDMTSRIASPKGFIAYYDFVTLDEVQTIQFGNIDEMRGALKSYLENGYANVTKFRVDGDAGVILSGNISLSKMRTFEATNRANLTEELPPMFHESALLDRFHGFIRGWKIPRLTDEFKVAGWALNTEYFSIIMHMLRSDGSYRTIVDNLVETSSKADARDVEAVKRIATAYLKLLFPHVQYAEDVDIDEFRTYCLERAVEMRRTIRYQLAILDEEFVTRPMPEFFLRN